MTSASVFQRFMSFVHLLSLYQICEVYQMRIKFRSVNTSKFIIFTNSYTAATTHTCSIDHNSVQTCYSWDFVWSCRFGNIFHHDNRTDCQHHSRHVATFKHFFKWISNEAFLTSAAIIRCNDKFVTYSSHLIFKNYKIFVTSADSSTTWRTLAEAAPCVPCTARKAFIMATAIFCGSKCTTAPLRRMIW